MPSAVLPRHVFGPTRVEVPKVGLGTWYLEQSDPKTAIAAVQLGLELGLTHIDTAELYLLHWPGSYPLEGAAAWPCCDVEGRSTRGGRDGST